ncbi:histidine kinase N-terminal 7TM domain-containing diguanylate cyclase [Planobispora takensis]|uniref:GGDEF domain-containing protein n=1 Tax=Planobispora takensis TaxID=1367882 RepID=A0A8J3T1D2_9ACTN|nr:diguanylate cyclase [Planobispora takensis]GII03312.1 GGDEF domain-containing protein [Planobispora takensis]
MAGDSLLALIFVLSAVVAFTVAALGWRRRHVTPAVSTLAFLAAGIGGWSTTDAVLVLTGVPVTAPLAAAAKFAAVSCVVAGFFCLSLAVVDRAWRLSRRTAALLAVEPVLLLVTVLTDDTHHLFHAAQASAGIQVPAFGPLFWVHAVYSYLLLVSGAVRMAHAWSRGPRPLRRVYAATLLGALPPALTDVLTLLGVADGVDITPIGFCVSTTVIYWSLMRSSVHELVAVERTHVFDVISDMVTTVDRSGRILDLNPAADRMFRRIVPGLPARLSGLSITELLGESFLPGQAEEGLEIDRTVVDAEGCVVDLSARLGALHDSRNEWVGWVLVGRDVTALNAQRRQLEEANAQLSEQQRGLQEANEQLREQVATIEALRANLAEQAVRDTLTGLHNRRFLMTALDREMSLAVAQDTPLSVALLDIDHFKQINDRYGHGAGDQVLIRFAKLLGGKVRQGDIVARYGGEEFVIALPGATGEQALARMNELRLWVTAGRIPAGGHTLSVTFSAGVAERVPGQNLAELLHSADEALYVAKGAGRNRVELAATEPGPSSAAA